MNSRDTEHYL